MKSAFSNGTDGTVRKIPRLQDHISHDEAVRVLKTIYGHRAIYEVIVRLGKAAVRGHGENVLFWLKVYRLILH